MTASAASASPSANAAASATGSVSSVSGCPGALTSTATSGHAATPDTSTWSITGTRESMRLAISTPSSLATSTASIGTPAPARPRSSSAAEA